ncbi:hypothetical protein AXW37_03600 [Yersinia ruckeri]|nr:hypothetical protein UGYR_06620 [Yersinia ruckeri]AUQ42172.1 hypothetical protein NJ56_09770 [Yersinia ruckeri]OEU24552.1 hypothetical protein BI323_05405 [Yersinia ruckeri]OIX31431.1 hypothetical protein AXW18_03585 [Yersinia ruckeri]OIX31862.1 hypothetical protein AXW19_03580 [Yersinia ruckeri]
MEVSLNKPMIFSILILLTPAVFADNTPGSSYVIDGTVAAIRMSDQGCRISFSEKTVPRENRVWHFSNTPMICNLAKTAYILRETVRVNVDVDQNKEYVNTISSIIIGDTNSKWLPNSL